MFFNIFICRAWSQVISSHFGNCFTFNHISYNRSLTTETPGHTFGTYELKEFFVYITFLYSLNLKKVKGFLFQGLSLIIDLEQKQYMNNGLTKGAGVRLVLHDKQVP